MNKAKPDILSVMQREGIIVHKAGRTYRGKCPMHGGKSNGSLTVYPDSQSWFCWGCGEGGDGIDFIKKLHGLSFNDACCHLGITPGRPVQPDPEIQRRREIQQTYNKAITEIYNELSDRARHLHRVRLQVKKHPGGLTPIGAVLFAKSMGELAEVDNKLDVLLTGTFEDQKYILAETKNEHRTTTISRAA